MSDDQHLDDNLDPDDAPDPEWLPADPAPAHWQQGLGTAVPSRPGRDPQHTSSLTLGQILEQYNSMLGWTQREFADRLGKDTAQVSRMMTGKVRPFDSTLQEIATLYQQNGLTGVTFDMLRAARDSDKQVRANPFDIDDRWVRLILQVAAQGTEVEESLFLQWSLQFRELTNLIRARRRPDIDDIDSHKSI